MWLFLCLEVEDERDEWGGDNGHEEEDDEEEEDKTGGADREGWTREIGEESWEE